MTSGRPLVSVVAVCYNHARFLIDCLDSIRAQSYQHFELIIMDDGSTDGSPGIIQQWLTKQRRACNFIAHASNRGLCATLNEALAVARGKYIAKIATDDLWLPRCLQRRLEALEKLPERVAVLYGDAYQISEAGEQLPTRLLADHGIQGSGPSGDVFFALLERNFVTGVTTMLRADCLRSVGGYDESLAYEDWDMWLRLAERYEFAFLDEIHAKYRVVPNSMSRTVVAYGSPSRLWDDLRILEKCLKSKRLDRRARMQVRLRMLARALRLAKAFKPQGAPAIARALHAWI